MCYARSAPVIIGLDRVQTAKMASELIYSFNNYWSSSLSNTLCSLVMRLTLTLPIGTCSVVGVHSAPLLPVHATRNRQAVIWRQRAAISKSLPPPVASGFACLGEVSWTPISTMSPSRMSTGTHANQASIRPACRQRSFHSVLSRTTTFTWMTLYPLNRFDWVG